MPSPPVACLPHDHDDDDDHHHHHHHHHHHPHNHAVMIPSGLHTHYFKPVDKPPSPYSDKPFDFPMIFDNPPDSIPSIGKSFPNKISKLQFTCSLTDFPDYQKGPQNIIITDDEVINKNSPPVIGKTLFINLIF
jgi:hypothetical protein